MKRFFCAIVIATAVIGCRQTTEPSGSITVSLAANPLSAHPGDTVTFVVNATGNTLVGVAIEYGDSNSDLYSTGGALTARVTFKHAYNATGTFEVRAVVTDAFAGERETTMSIVVN